MSTAGGQHFLTQENDGTLISGLKFKLRTGPQGRVAGAESEGGSGLQGEEEENAGAVSWCPGGFRFTKPPPTRELCLGSVAQGGDLRFGVRVALAPIPAGPHSLAGRRGAGRLFTR